MALRFYLLTETSFDSSYLVTKWAQAFNGNPEFKGIILRENRLDERVRTLRESFHQQYQGQTNPSKVFYEEIQDIYPDLCSRERAMIKSFGVPAHSATFHPQTIFLGSNLNSDSAREWLEENCSMSDPPFIFVFLNQLLKPWWIEITKSRLINGHSAVLPFARGMFAIENVAISLNIEDFKRAAGGTIQYIDTGVDTGPIISVEMIDDPFHFESIWELKGYSFMLVYEMLIDAAIKMLKRSYTIPVGINPDVRLLGPNFKSKDFTPEARVAAEQGFLKMRITVKGTNNVKT